MTASLQSKATIVENQPFDLQEFLSSGVILGLGGGVCVVGSGEYTRSAASIPGQLSVYSPDFLLTNENPWYCFPRYLMLPISHLLSLLSEPHFAGLEWLDADREDFRQSFETIQQLIASGELHKAVPVAHRRALGDFSDQAKGHALANSLKISLDYQVSVFGLWDQNQGIIGITPESLFTMQADGTITTMALAGTRSNEPGTPSLLADSKEVREHAIVIEGVVERLSPFAELTVSPVSERKLNSLVHLHAEIKARPNRPTAFEDWVRALHPTPAIGAWPTEAGMRWIQSEPNSKKRIKHGAPFGAMIPGTDVVQCLVAIRCVQWQENSVQITAGCGILAESLFEKEWNEVNSKMDSVQFGLRL